MIRGIVLVCLGPQLVLRGGKRQLLNITKFLPFKEPKMG
jgi:hypothetical protein